eukprot:10350914-Heterocapsa_arctica.AAC.1
MWTPRRFGSEPARRTPAGSAGSPTRPARGPCPTRRAPRRASTRAAPGAPPRRRRQRPAAAARPP